MRISKWPVGAVLSCLMLLIFAWFGIWPTDVCLTVGVLALLFTIGVFVNVQFMGD